MPLILRSLVDDLRLPVHAGAGGLDRAVSWVHGTELVDPTPFLEGGELLLTTGLAVRRGFRGYVERLAAVGVVGLGFGTGLSHAVVPPGLVAAAEREGLPLLEVPRETPFIALSKAVSRAVAADKYAALTRADEARRALTRAAVGRDGVAAVVRKLGQWVRARVVLLDSAGEPAHGFGWRPLPDLAPELARLRASGGLASSAFEADGAHVVAQVLGGRGRGFLAVARDEPWDPADLGVVTTAASLLTLSLARSDSARRRLRTAEFHLLAAGRADLVPGLPDGPVHVVVVDGVAVEDVPGFAAEVDGHVVVVAAEVPVLPGARLGVSTPVGIRAVGEGFRQALAALAVARPSAPEVRFADLAGAGLMSLLPDGAGKAFAESLLAPLSPELRETLRVWLAHHGQWDPAAARLGVHRHTLRNRVRKAEALLGRSLDVPGVRAELWLALNA
ncbi:PucR family transcriptional regulator [Umezawaea sp. Da 62-37]|uniref:PucR family transcriptional regulator n=1 Tax=Umezawaea sp. Da 62-37 TaxID=3075927 RepID=UPI0028F743F3|nr:PucR family transcriptional regulator [Umezawaea sp. Da 62-37]WNV84336.1 PucR family transcriptional regulator [Umezawaea sp. Da 62-37]